MKPSQATPGLYRHFKGGYYRLIEVAKHTETKERLAIYHKVHEPGRLWARPLAMFAGLVRTTLASGSNVVPGKVVPRFERVRIEHDPEARRREVRRDRPTPSVRGSRTSRAAARAARAHAVSMRERVYRAIVASGEHGCTREWLMLQLHMKHPTVGARVKGLIDDGLIVDSGKRRKTTTGHSAEVLVAVAKD